MWKQSSTRPTLSELPETPARRQKSQVGRSSRVSKQRRRKSAPLRAGLAVVAGRAAGALSRRLHLGGGTSIAGIVARQMYPQIIEHLAAQLEYGSVIVTGTNGKTTTSGFIAAIMRQAGLTVWHNKEGSNLMRGVATELITHALPNGRLRRAGNAISILEIDEATLPQIVTAITPRVVVFTNLFRDQLDRYGEVDSVAAYWRRAINTLPASSTLVLNADDPTTARLGEDFAGNVLYYGVDDLSLTLPTASDRHQVIDTRTCPRCGSDYVYDARFYSHMGHYHCPNGDLQRPQPNVRATEVHTERFDQIRINVTLDTEQQELVVPLPGLYNVYNALAAITAALALDVSWKSIISGIEQAKPAFGRGESVTEKGRTIRLLLAKNPTGFNEVMRTLFSDGIPKHIMFVLNDNIADGQDISWIWDVDFEQAVGKTKTVVAAGKRALDLALRLKYAGMVQEEITIVPPAPLRAARGVASARGRRLAGTKKGLPTRKTGVQEAVERAQRAYGLKKALDLAIEQTPVGETLYIVPTYTGLLELHRELEQRGAAPHYWEGRDA